MYPGCGCSLVVDVPPVGCGVAVCALAVPGSVQYAADHGVYHITDNVSHFPDQSAVLCKILQAIIVTKIILPYFMLIVEYTFFVFTAFSICNYLLCVIVCNNKNDLLIY